LSDLTIKLDSQNHWLADGVQTVWNFEFSGGYINRSHVRAYYEDNTDPDNPVRTDLVINPDTDFVGDYQILVEPPVPAGFTMVVYRATPRDLPLVDFQDGGGVTELNLDTTARQAVFLAQESADYLGVTTTGDMLDLSQETLANAGAAAASAANAAISEAAASASASTSASWAASALASALAAANSAANAAATVASLALSSGASLIGFIQAGIGAVARTVQAKLRETVSPEDHGAVGDGVIDDYAALQAAHNASLEVKYQPGKTYYISQKVLLRTGARSVGAGIGSTLIRHPTSHAFGNVDSGTTGNEDIEISGFTFDADGTFDGGVSMTGIRGLRVHHCHFSNVDPVGVSVGVGVASLSTADASDITVDNCVFDVPDYGVVIDSAVGTTIENVFIHKNRFTINWGSGVSFAGNIAGATVSGNVFRLLGDMPDLYAATGVGIGVKIWDGTDIADSNSDILVSGNTFFGPVSRTEIVGISVTNFGKRVSVDGNTFYQMSEAMRHNFAGTGALGVAFTNNICDTCDYGVRADDSTDTEPVYQGNQFLSCGYGIKATLKDGIVSGNKFLDTTYKAIWLVSPTEHGNVSGNNIKNTGEEAIYQPTNSSNNDGLSVQGNTIFNSCTSVDATYNVIQLNAQAALVSNNYISNESTTEKPIYIIGSTAGANYRILSANWMYGARTGYRGVTGANDVYANNIERGGIG
jgi:hypothetical protein